MYKYVVVSLSKFLEENQVMCMRRAVGEFRLYRMLQLEHALSVQDAAVRACACCERRPSRWASMEQAETEAWWCQEEHCCVGWTEDRDEPQSPCNTLLFVSYVCRIVSEYPFC